MQFKEINYLRFYAILSIVIWHCFVCPLTCWNLIESNHGQSIIQQVASFLIPNANMPLFTFISGFLFAYACEKKNNYQQFISFIKNKINRLVIPFFILGTVVCISAPERELSQIIWGEGSHLWYCMMLFWCFVIGWILNKINNKTLWLVVSLASLGIVLICYSNWSMIKMPLGIHNALFYFCYFALGQLTYLKISDIEEHKYIIIISLSVLLILSIYFHVGRLIILFKELLLIYVLFFIAKYIPARYAKKSTFVSVICKYSFGIYVFHEWISWIMYHQSYLIEILNKSPYLTVTIFTILDFFISFLITHYSLKSKIGRYLLL